MFVVVLACICAVAAGIVAVVRAPQLPRRWPLLIIAALPAVGLLVGVHHSMLCVLAIVGTTAWAWSNRQLHGMPLILCGALLNLVVMAYHNGAMPIALDTMRSVGYTGQVGALLHGSKDVIVGATPLALLADWIILPLGGDRYMVASPGDMLLAAGIGWWLWFSGAAQRGKDDIRSLPTLSHRQQAATISGTKPAPSADQTRPPGGS